VKLVYSSWTQHLINNVLWLFIDLQGVILHTSYYQIPVVINQYELPSNRGRNTEMALKPLETHELELRKKSGGKVKKKKRKTNRR